MMRPTLPALLLTLTLTGCGWLAPDYARPDLALPTNWQNKAEQNENKTENFFSEFNDPQLTTLVQKALAANQDLAASAARIEQARAAAQIAGSNLYPQASLGGSANRTFNNPVTGGRDSAVNNSSATLSLSYELDFWGRIHNTARAADLRADATAYDYQTLALVTAADTASNYIRYLADSARLTVAENTRRDVAETARLTEARYLAGTLSSVENNQQKVALATQDAAIASLRAQVNADLTALSILTGVPAGTLQLQPARFDDLKPSPVKITRPDEVLNHRPDILAAESELKAADYDIGAARAAFLPTVQLSANGGLIGLLPQNTLSSTAGLGLSASQSLFSGGALTGQLWKSEAAKNEQVATYRQTVLTASKEVEDAIASLNSNVARAEALSRARDAASATFTAVQARYKFGAIDQLTLLDSERSLFSTQDSAISAQADRLTSAITLWRTLGGPSADLRSLRQGE